MRRWLPWLALGVIVVVAIVVLVVRSQPSDSAASRAHRLERELACPVCTGESVAESNAPESRAIRDDIADRIRQGQSDTQIRAAYTRVYGERILLNPSNGGLAFVAWGIPVVVVIVGVAGIAVALRRWSRQPRLEASADDEVVVARARSRDA
jgi:cytochrome c-type biogenesis protein CcmH